MSTAEDYISEDENTDLSRDDSKVFSDDHQEHSDDLDELYASITDSSASLIDEFDIDAAIETETPSSEDEADISALDALYSNSEDAATDEVKTIDEIADDVSSETSIMEELEAMYGSSDDSDTGDSEPSANIEELITESISEDVSDSDLILEELEAMLGNASQLVTQQNEEDEHLETVEDFSDNEQPNAMTALDELKAFLNETPSHEGSESSDENTSDHEYSFEYRRSVLDELQNLLQSCIDELKNVADGKITSSDLSTGVAYPDRDELKRLLEDILGQLMLISGGVVSLDSGEGASVLDELSALLGESYSDAGTDADSDVDKTDTYVSTTELEDSYDADEILSVEADDVISTDDEVVASDSVLKEFEDLLPGSGETETEESEQTSDAMISDRDDEIEGNSVLEELEAYFADREVDSSDVPYTDTEEPEKDIDISSLSDDSDATSDVLEQLETMLAETAGTSEIAEEESIEISEDINSAVDDSTVEQKPFSRPKPYNETRQKETIRSYDNAQPAHVDKDAQEQRAGVREVSLSVEQKSSKRLPMFAISLLVAGVIVYGYLSDDENDMDQPSQVMQSEPVEKSVIAKKEYDSPIPQQTETVASVGASGMDDLITSVEPPEEETVYEAEVYQQPEQSVVDEMSSDETSDQDVEAGVTQAQLSEAVEGVRDDQFKESINQGLMNLQDSTERSIRLLSERMDGAESSLLRLQLALEGARQADSDYQIKQEQAQENNKENIVSINDRINELEGLVTRSQSALKDSKGLESVNQIKHIQDENKKDIFLINDRIIELERLIASSQSALEASKGLESVEQIKRIQDENKKDIILINDRIIELEGLIASAQSAPGAAKQLESDGQIKRIQDENEKNITLINSRITELEEFITRSQSALDEFKRLESEHQLKHAQDENKENIAAIDNRITEAEASVPELQLPLDVSEKLEPVESISSITSKVKASRQSTGEAADTVDKTFNIWSVHLFAYYGKPPPAAELRFLDVAGVPYDIERVTVKGGIWYRVLVNNSTEYSAAKKYAVMLKKRLGIKKIWISKKQYSYD